MVKDPVCFKRVANRARDFVRELIFPGLICNKRALLGEGVPAKLVFSVGTRGRVFSGVCRGRFGSVRGCLDGVVNSICEASTCSAYRFSSCSGCRGCIFSPRTGTGRCTRRFPGSLRTTCGVNRGVTTRMLGR